MSRLKSFYPLSFIKYEDFNIGDFDYGVDFSYHENNYTDIFEYEKTMNVGDVWFDFRALTINIKVKSGYIYDCDLEYILPKDDSYETKDAWAHSWWNHLTRKPWFTEEIAKRFKCVYEKNKEDIEILKRFYKENGPERVREYLISKGEKFE